MSIISKEEFFKEIMEYFPKSIDEYIPQMVCWVNNRVNGILASIDLIEDDVRDTESPLVVEDIKAMLSNIKDSAVDIHNLAHAMNEYVEKYKNSSDI